MKRKLDYTLYLVTDSALKSTKTLEQAVEKAIKGGCTVVQLREKEISSKDFFSLAVRVKAVTDKYNIPLIINDRVDIALAVNADGVHIGQSDMPCKIVRGLIGGDKILGVSASNLSEALKAQEDGADYLGVGAMFKTDTKTNAEIVSIDSLAEIARRVTIPTVAIGGISKDTIPHFKGVNIDGIAVVSAIISQSNITTAAKGIKKLFLKNNPPQ